MNKMKIALSKSDGIMNSQIDQFYKFFEESFMSLHLENLSLQKFQSNEERLKAALKKMDLVNDRNGKVGKALLEKRSRQTTSHINLTQEEVDNLKFNIESLTFYQKQELIPIVTEFATNHNDKLYSFNLEELSSECLAKLNEKVYSLVMINQRKANQRKRREMKAQQKSSQAAYN